VSSLLSGGSLRRIEPLLVPLAVLTAALVFPLTITGASLALPGIVAEFAAGTAATQWVVTGYNATFAAFLALSGALCDVLGRKGVFLTGTALFAAAGLAAAFAPDIGTLNVARLVCGLGAAAATASGAALLAERLDGPSRARAFAGLGMVLGAGLAFGPTVSGLLVAAGGWRTTFAVPAMAAAIACLTALAIPGRPRPRGGPGVDWVGGALFTAMLLGLVVTLNEAPDRGWTHPFTLVMAALTVAVGIGFALVEGSRREPMFDLAILRNRRFTACALTAGVFMAVLVPFVIYLPTYLIQGTGRSAAQAGAVMLLLTVPTLVLPALGARLSRRLRPGVFLPFTLACTALGAGLLLLALARGGEAWWLFALPFVLIGVGPGLTNGVLDGMAVTALPEDKAGTAAGLFNTARLATEAVSLTVVAAVLAQATGGRLSGDALSGAMSGVTAGLAAAALLSAVAVAVLARGSGPAVRAPQASARGHVHRSSASAPRERRFDAQQEAQRNPAQGRSRCSPRDHRGSG
jgi:MFS family permease